MPALANPLCKPTAPDDLMTKVAGKVTLVIFVRPDDLGGIHSEIACARLLLCFTKPISSTISYQLLCMGRRRSSRCQI